MPTERPPLVGEVVTTFADRGCSVVSATDPPVVNLGFVVRSSSVVLTWLRGPRSRPAASQEMWKRRESNPGPLDLRPETLTTRPQRRSLCVLRKLKISACFLGGILRLPSVHWSSCVTKWTLEWSRLSSYTHRLPCPLFVGGQQLQ
jgi:hypothetical protein